MKRNALLAIAITFSLFANAQYVEYPINRKAAGNYKHQTIYDKELFNKVEKDAFNRVSRNDIYSYEVLQSYLDERNMSVDDLKKENSELGKLFKQVVTKKKDFPNEYKRSWRQEYYNYLFDKTYSELDKKNRQNDSVDRYKWIDSEIYMGLKLYCSQTVPPMDNESSYLIEKYNVDKFKAFNHYVSYAQPVKPSTIVEKANIRLLDPSNEELAKITELDINGLRSFLQEKMRDINNFIDLYGSILKESGYFERRIIPDFDTYSRNSPSREEFVYGQEKNNPRVIELNRLYDQWKDTEKNHSWDYYLLSKSSRFKKACTDIIDAINYRKTNPLTNGVYKIGSFEVPYKVVDDKLVVDGICTITYVDDQYPNATGEWYKKRTPNFKMVVKVENGVAVSKTFSGTQKVWMPDENVYKRTKGGYLEKTAATLAAKPVVVKTINVADVANNLDFKIAQNNMLDKLAFSKDPDVSLQHLCKKYLEGAEEMGDKDWYLKKIKMPLQPVDLSKVYE